MKIIFDQFKKLDFKDWLIIIMAAMLLGSFIACRHYLRKADEKIVVINDSISIYKNKLDSEYVAKNIYIQTADQLKKTNQELYDEIKNLKDNPVVVTKIVTQTVIKEITAQSDSTIEHKDSTNVVWKNLYWSAKHPQGFYTLNGNTDVRSDFSSFQTTISSLSVPAKITFDIIENKKEKQLMLIGRSDNPYVSITNVNGTVVDPKNSKVLKSYFPQKHWHIGLQAGYGLGLHGNTVIMTPTLGVGLTYSLFSF